MPTRENRRRIEIDAEVYAMLEREARWLHIPVANLATLYIREGMERAQRGSPRAAPIAEEGSPSPALADLQRRSHVRLAAAEDDSEHA